MDPFEGRLSFLNHLKHLNASHSSSQKCAQFALRHSDLAEDLFSCILEELESTNLNVRVNLLHLVETILDNPASKESLYPELFSTNVERILKSCVPAEGGRVNLQVVNKVLERMYAKGYIDVSLMEGLQRNDFSVHEFGKEEILRRFEEDRERHKRLRENIWQVAPDMEFDRIWEESGDFDEIDWVYMREEYEKLEFSTG